jgi:predicted lipoprotein with Yx(FWY)xxD motif
MIGRNVTRLAVIAALFLAACGTTGSTASSSPSPAASPTLAEIVITVSGTSEPVLAAPSGLTLYYLTSDVATAPKCAGACITHWPPLMSTTSPSAMVNLPGKLTVVQNANGSQVAYNGHLLYEFANDKTAGDAKGEGVQAFGGTWHVATPTLPA